MRRFLAVGGLVVLLAACGSSGGSTSDAGSSPTTSTTAPADPAAKADQRIAAAGVIRGADLSGWKVTARGPAGSSGLKEAASGVTGCEPLVAGTRDGEARAQSPKLSQNGSTADGDIDVYATPAELQAQLELYRDPTIVTCLQNLFTKTLKASAPAGATVDSVSVSPIAVDASGDGAYGFRLTAAVTHDGTPSTILSDVVGVTVGRAGATLTVTTDNAATLAQVESTVLPKVTQRLRDAQA